MRSSGRYTLLAFNSAAALGGVAVMAILVHAVMREEPQPEARAGAQAVAQASSPVAARMVFVQPGALVPPEQATKDALPSAEPVPALRSSAGGAWSTEVQPEAMEAQQPLRRFTLLPSLRLPWQTAKPAAPPPKTHTLKSRLAELSPSAIVRLATRFDAAKAAWPPAEIAFVAIKDEKILELHARGAGGAWKLVHRYPVQAASGGLGPKLRQGDKQVPEGFYTIAFLNPNSAYHVSLAVNYPNAFDRQMAARDGRKDLGGDIMIHGKNLSAGCLAMGDEAVEELFVLAAQTGLPNVRLLIAPTDMRQHGVPSIGEGRPDWLPKLYAELAVAMAEYKGPPQPKATGLLSFFMK